MPNYNNLYRIVCKTKNSQIKGILNKFLDGKNKYSCNQYKDTMNNELSERLDFFRATINTKNKEIVFKNNTARYMFGQQYAVIKDQKELVLKYMVFTDYLLKEIPLRKQGDHNFGVGELLGKFEEFYSSIFGEGWQDSRDILLNNFSKLIN